MAPSTAEDAEQGLYVGVEQRQQGCARGGGGDTFRGEAGNTEDAIDRIEREFRLRT